MITGGFKGKTFQNQHVANIGKTIEMSKLFPANVAHNHGKA